MIDGRYLGVEETRADGRGRGENKPWRVHLCGLVSNEVFFDGRWEVRNHLMRMASTLWGLGAGLAIAGWLGVPSRLHRRCRTGDPMSPSRSCV